MVTPTVIALGSPLATGPSNTLATDATTTLHPQPLGGDKNAASRNLDMEKLVFRVFPSHRDGLQKDQRRKRKCPGYEYMTDCKGAQVGSLLHIPFG